VVQWNPEVATQLMVASDDDMSPSLQLWDLRNSVSPIKEFHGHAKARRDPQAKPPACMSLRAWGPGQAYPMWLLCGTGGC